MDRKTTNPSNREGLQLRSELRSSSTSSSDFVLQWGNRKRVRCMKVQSKNQTINNEPVTVQRSTTRIDRRVVRSDLNNNKSTTPTPNHKNNNNAGAAGGTGNLINAAGNGYLNLRQRPASPSPRFLRNTESSMKGHSNGAKSFVSPDRGDRKGTTSTSNNNIHHNNSNNNHHHSKSCNAGSRYNEQPDVKKLDGCNEKAATLWLPNFVFALTNKEKEEDFLAIKGCKLPQRPKKRAKVIQRTLNLVSPGAWLCDLTLERYEVREKKVPKKRPRGLKGMGNMDSDSE